MDQLAVVNSWLLIPVLGMVVWEDFKFRGVSWWLFLLLAVMAFFIEYQRLTLQAILINLAFVTIQLILLTLYFSIKEKKVVNLLKRYLGLGDILFWGILCLLFSSLNFTVFFMTSMIVVMIVVGVWKIAKIKPHMSTVPLAGIQAGVLLGAVVLKLLSNKFLFRDDYWIELIIVG